MSGNSYFPTDLFPKLTPLDKKDIFTDRSFTENIKEAQKAKVPYYFFAITKFKDLQEPIYYDGVYLYSYLHLYSKFAPIKLGDSAHVLNTEQVHFFALSLFKFDQKDLFCPIDSEQDYTIFQIELPKNSDEESIAQYNLLIDALNYHKDNEDLRTFQEKVSQLISSEKISLFSNSVKTLETLKWQWCASTNNINNKIELIYHCAINQPYQKIATTLLNQLKDDTEIKITSERLQEAEAILNQANEQGST